jgi:hypothetical protein
VTYPEGVAIVASLADGGSAMTQRKPPNMSVPDWVERQIRTAQANGDFENLPGAGKPIPDLDRPQDPLSWVASYLRRENVDVSALLPQSLALAKEVEVLAERLLKERSTARVRQIVEDLNERILQAHRRPQSGPPLRVGRLNVDAVVEEWRTARTALDEAERAAVAARDSQAKAEPAPRRRWLRRGAR